MVLQRAEKENGGHEGALGPADALRWAATVAGSCLMVPWLAEASLFLTLVDEGYIADPATELHGCLCLLVFAASCALALAWVSKAQTNGEKALLGNLAVGSLVLTGIGSSLYATMACGGQGIWPLGIVLGFCMGTASGCGVALWIPAWTAMKDIQLTAGVFATALGWCVAFNACRPMSGSVVAAAGFVLSLGSVVIAYRVVPGLRPTPSVEAPVDGCAGDQKSPDVESPLFRQSVRHWNGRMLAVSLLIGFSFSTMLLIFTTTTGRGEIASDEWYMLFVGVPAGALCVFAGWIHTREFNFLLSLRISCILAIPAFFPLKVGSYALRFAFDFTVVALVAVGCVLAMLWVSSDRFLRGFGARLGLLSPAGFAVGVSASILFVLLIVRRGPMGEDMVYFAGLLSLVAVFVATNMLVSPELLLTIERVATGRFPAHVDIAEKLVGESAQANGLALVCKRLALEKCLTDRETEVLMILARGSGLARVQEDLLISEGTAITHRNHIYRKLDVHSKQELIDLVDLRMSER